MSRTTWTGRRRGAIGWAAAGIVAVVLGWGGDARAAIDDSLNTFFTDLQGAVTGTAAGAYQSQSRGYLTGGALSARVPMQSLQLAAVTPPRFNLGCNGFDATFGGLSYVSLSRFVQLLQQLGTGAVAGFAFQLATEYLSPTIGSVLSKIEAAARFINTQLNVAPCQTGMQMGRALVSAWRGTGSTDVPALSQRWRALNGLISDTVEGLEQQATRTKQDVATELQGDPQWTIKGNLVWQALKEGFPSMLDEEVRLIMSVIGTTTLDDEGTEKHYPPLLGVKDLLDAVPGQQYRVYTCPEPVQCLQPQETIENNVRGMAERVRQVMQGIQSNLQTNTPLALGQQDWLEQSGLPMYVMLKQYERDPVAMARIVNESARLLAADALRYYLQRLTAQLSKALSVYMERHPNAKVDLSVIRAGVLAAEEEAREIARKEAHRMASELQIISSTMKHADWAYRRR